MSMIPVTAKVDVVTVSEDRAHVVRRGDVQLAAGVNEIVIEEVATVLVDKTLKVAVDAGITVGAVRVERRAIHTERERPVDVATLDAQIDERAQDERDVARARKRMEVELAGLDSVIAQLVSDAAVDTSWGVLSVSATRARLLELETEEKEKRASFLQIAEQHRRITEELARLRRRRDVRETTATRESARIVIVLSCAAAQKTELRVDYIVPGACWRPAHTARLHAGKVRFATDACVWQNTGEAWTDADVAFSTERPSLGREPPLLAADRLASQKKQETLVVETRHEEIHTAGLGQEGSAASRVVPGIDDGGQPRVVRGAARATIETDGKPHRVPLSVFETDAASELVMCPQLAALAIRKTTQTNAGGAPILAGPVDLVEESGLVGRTQVLFVAPSERFELGWGPDPGVRARRVVEENEEEPGALSSWITRVYRVTLHVSSLDDRPRTIAVSEAIPVSELEKVQIALDPKETTDAPKPDEDGFVRWQLKLPPHGRALVKMRYVLKRHKDVAGL